MQSLNPDVAVTSDDETLVVHALRLRGYADLPTVASSVKKMGGSDDPRGLRVQPQLDALVENRWARYRDEPMPGWLLTRAGRSRGEDLLAAELDEHGLRDRIEEVYRRFFRLNGPFLAACSAWQVRPQQDGTSTINDHCDARYDEEVISRIVELDADMVLVCADLAAMLVRFESYGPRFGQALERVRAGETEWMAKPSIDSYHSVWFELHEDLLATLGIERTKEHHGHEETNGTLRTSTNGDGDAV